LCAKLEKLLSLLGDNVWHNIDEMAKTLEIPQTKLQQILAFLTETELIQHNPATNQIKLDQNWKTLIINQKETEAQPEKNSRRHNNNTATKNPHNPMHTHHKPNRKQPRTRNPHKKN